MFFYWLLIWFGFTMLYWKTLMRSLARIMLDNTWLIFERIQLLIWGSLEKCRSSGSLIDHIRTKHTQWFNWRSNLRSNKPPKQCKINLTRRRVVLAINSTGFKVWSSIPQYTFFNTFLAYSCQTCFLLKVFLSLTGVLKNSYFCVGLDVIVFVRVVWR